MQGFVSDKGKTTAVGNSNRNAQGDLLGSGGKIIASAKEITNTAYNNVRPASKKVKINPLEQEINRKEIVGADGIARWEVTFADGSVEIQVKEIQVKETASAPKKKAKVETTKTPPPPDFEIDLDEKL
jgi:methionine aminopeptidase